jgi:hypothetical protein
VDSFSPACSLVGSDVICTIGNLPRQTGSALHSVTYQALVALPIIGHVTVTGNEADPDPSNHYLRFTTTVTP